MLRAYFYPYSDIKNLEPAVKKYQEVWRKEGKRKADYPNERKLSFLVYELTPSAFGGKWYWAKAKNLKARRLKN